MIESSAPTIAPEVLMPPIEPATLVRSTVILHNLGNGPRGWAVSLWNGGSATLMRKGNLSICWPEARRLAFNDALPGHPAPRRDLIEGWGRTLEEILADPYSASTYVVPAGHPEKQGYLVRLDKSGDDWSFGGYEAWHAAGGTMPVPDIHLIDDAMALQKNNRHVGAAPAAWFQDVTAIEISTNYAKRVEEARARNQAYLDHTADLAEGRRKAFALKVQVDAARRRQAAGLGR